MSYGTAKVTETSRGRQKPQHYDSEQTASTEISGKRPLLTEQFVQELIRSILERHCTKSSLTMLCCSGGRWEHWHCSACH